MNRELRTIRLALERLQGQCAPTILSELSIYEARIADLDDRSKRFGETRDISAARMEAYYGFQTAYSENNLDRIVARSSIETELRKLEHFEGLPPASKLDYYLTRIADLMQKQLRNENAHDVMYVPLHSVFLRYGEAKSGKSQPKRSRSNRLIERIVDYDDPLLIVRGQPGTGKSVAMRQVVRTIAIRSIGRAAGLIPLFIPLGQIGHVRSPEPSFLLNQISRFLYRAYDSDQELAVAAAYIDASLPTFLENGQCLFIFDGMDELPKQGYDETCRNLLSCGRNWTDKTGNRCVFSCREFDYPRELGIDSLVIFPFEWEDVDEYLRHHLPPTEYSRRRQEARKLWVESRVAKSMLDNPFFLHLATRHLLERPNDPIPTSRGPLFDTYVDRIFRIDSNDGARTTAENVRMVLESLAFWLTEAKTSGTTASLSDLRATPSGIELATALSELRAYSVAAYFIDFTADTITFRHHRLRELFAALAMKRRFFSDGQPTVNSSNMAENPGRSYFGSVAGDIWYFETIVMLAPLLNERDVTNLIDFVLDDGNAAKSAAYRAILAAECLDSSPAKVSRYLCDRVFSALISCIDDDQIGSIEKAECWQVMPHLHLTNAQLERLAESLSQKSRFILEHALASFAVMSDHRILRCQSSAFHLLKAAAQLAALDRLATYSRWIRSRPFRSPSFLAIYGFVWLFSLAVWASPAPATFISLSILLPPLFFQWLLPSAAAALVIIVQAFFWFNEDKRTFHACWIGISSTIRSLSYRKPPSPQLPRRIELPRPAPPANAAATKEFDKWALLSVFEQAIDSPDIEMFLISQGLLKTPCDSDLLGKERLKDAFRSEAPKITELLDSSTELNYKMSRAAVLDMCARLCAHQAPTLESTASDIMFSLRREARRHRRSTLDSLRYDKHATNIDKMQHRLAVSADEAEFMLQNASAHSYLVVLLANDFIDAEVMDLAEQNNAEEWLANASRSLFREIMRTIRASGQPLPRQAVRDALTKLSKGVGSLDEQPNRMDSALRELGEDTLRGFERLRALRSVARVVVSLLTIGGLIVCGIVAYYEMAAHRHSTEAASNLTAALSEEGREAGAVQSLVFRSSDPPPAPAKDFKGKEWFNKWDLMALSQLISTSDHPGAVLLNNGLVPQGGSQAVELDRKGASQLSEILQTMAELVDVSTELDYHIQHSVVVDVCTFFIQKEHPISPAPSGADIIYELRRKARDQGGFEGLQYKQAEQAGSPRQRIELVSKQELIFLSSEAQAHSYLTVLYANGMITSAVMAETETRGLEDWFANSAREFLLAAQKRSKPNGVPRSCVIVALGQLAGRMRDMQRSDVVHVVLENFDKDVDHWWESKRIAAEAAQRAAQARSAAEREELVARAEKRRQLELILFVFLVVLPTLTWLTWRYLVPSIGLLSVDVSLPAGVARLLAFAGNDQRDTGLRRLAIRRLGLSDDQSTTDGLRELRARTSTPEPLVVEIDRVLHNLRRREMRAGVM